MYSNEARTAFLARSGDITNNMPSALHKPCQLAPSRPKHRGFFYAQDRPWPKESRFLKLPRSWQERISPALMSSLHGPEGFQDTSCPESGQ
jgi:hypothetical protein